MAESVTVNRSPLWPDTMTSPNGDTLFIPLRATFDYTSMPLGNSITWGISAVRVTGSKIVNGVTTRNTFAIDWSSYNVGRVPTWLLNVGRDKAPK